jgi:polar amino acid transport system permease protein
LEDASTERGRPEDIKAVPVRHPGRWVAAVVASVTGASLLWSFLNNSRAEWNVFTEWFFNPRITDGVLVTIELTAVSMIVGLALGVVLAVMRQSANPVLKSISWFYIWLFRGTPLLVQLIFWFNIAALYPQIRFGVPFGGPALIQGNANTVISAMVAAYLGLSLNEGAYMAEIVRAGLLSVDEGQNEAAEALGLSRMQTMRHVVLPQAMKVIVPPTGNETINMLKTTSLVFVLGNVHDLLTSAQLIYAANYKVIPLLLVASAWYLILTSILYVGQYYLERRFGRGSSRNLPPTPMQRMVGTWRKWRPNAAEVSQ